MKCDIDIYATTYREVVYYISRIHFKRKRVHFEEQIIYKPPFKILILTWRGSNINKTKIHQMKKYILTY